MVRIKKSQQIIEQLLQEYANCPPAYGEIEMETLFDEKQHRYQLIALGWENKKRIHGCLIHIVLGFHPQQYRKFGDFAEC